MKYLIKKTRKEKGISQQELVQRAEELGLSLTQPQLSSWESGKTEPNDKNIDVLCRVLGCEMDDLISMGEMSMKEFKNDAYKFGSNFESNWLKDMFRRLTQNCDTEEKIKILTDNVMKLSSMKGIAIPQSFTEVIRPSDDSDKILYQFIISFWNGSLVNQKNR